MSQGRQGSLPPGMPPEQVTYEWFGENYHFTEDMTRSLSLDALEWWPVIKAARSRAAEVRDGQDERVSAARQDPRAPQKVQFVQGMKTPGSG